jgi:integrase
MNRDAYGSFERNLSQETWPVCSQSEQSNAAPASAGRGNSVGEPAGKSDGTRVAIDPDLLSALACEWSYLPLRDAMDLAYLTGQRPADALLMTEHDIDEGCLIVNRSRPSNRCASSSSASWPS